MTGPPFYRPQKLGPAGDGLPGRRPGEVHGRRLTPPRSCRSCRNCSPPRGPPACWSFTSAYPFVPAIRRSAHAAQPFPSLAKADFSRPAVRARKPTRRLLRSKASRWSPSIVSALSAGPISRPSCSRERSKPPCARWRAYQRRQSPFPPTPPSLRPRLPDFFGSRRLLCGSRPRGPRCASEPGLPADKRPSPRPLCSATQYGPGPCRIRDEGESADAPPGSHHQDPRRTLPGLALYPAEGAGPWPAVIFFMDGLGIRPVMWEMGQRLADGGYLVLLPDLYYRRCSYPPFFWRFQITGSGRDRGLDK